MHQNGLVPELRVMTPVGHIPTVHQATDVGQFSDPQRSKVKQGNAGYDVYSLIMHTTFVYSSVVKLRLA